MIFVGCTTNDDNGEESISSNTFFLKAKVDMLIVTLGQDTLKMKAMEIQG